MTADPIRVLVVDDQRLIRESIASLLDIQPGISVVGVAVDGRDAIEQAVALSPDVVLMDVRMPELDGVAAAAALARRSPACRVVMLTTFDDEEYVVRALRAGAAGYLLKDLPARELANAVRLAHAGVTQLDSAAAARLATALSRFPGAPVHAEGTEPPHPPHTAPAHRPETGPAHLETGPAHRPETGNVDTPETGNALTTREIEVLRLVARGWTNREVAAHLFLSEGTVKNHISRILTRLGLRDRTQAAVYAHDHGLL